MVKLTSILNWNGIHNIPKKYIQRAMFQGTVYGKTKTKKSNINPFYNSKTLNNLDNNHGITPTVVFNYTKDFIYDKSAPWTTESQFTNNPQKRNKNKVLVPPIKEWGFYLGDRVSCLIFNL
jgi:hypothetical protein